MNSIRHTQEQLYITPKIGYVDCDAKFRSNTELLLHWATFSGDIHASPRNNQNHKLTVTSTFLSSNSKHDFCYIMANISPSHIQQCLNLAIHFSLRHLAAKMLSPLHNNFISFPSFFPSNETCSININPLFHPAIKNLHIKANSIFVFFILLYFTTTLSEGIAHTHTHTHTHTHARTHFFAKNGNKHSYR